MDKPGPKSVTSCLGNVTAAREGNQIGGGKGEIPSYMDIWECEAAN